MILTDLRHLIVKLCNLILKLEALGRTLLSEPLGLLHHSLILLSELCSLGVFRFCKLFCLSLEHLDLLVLRLEVLQLRAVLLELVLQLRVQLNGLSVVLRDLGLGLGQGGRDLVQMLRQFRELHRL